MRSGLLGVMGNFDIEKDQPVLPWVNQFYYSVFPGLRQCYTVLDKEKQILGIDKILRFKVMPSITIDEKIRYKFYKGDILLEEYSNWERQTPGWLMKDHALCDYISYIVRTEKLVYLLDYRKLKFNWDKNYEKWLNKYKRKFGKTTDRYGNVLYHTSNIPVPIKELEIAHSNPRNISISAGSD